MSDCTRCTAPSAGAFLCSTCCIALRIDLGDVTPLLAELDVTRSRQDQLTSLYDKGRGGGEQPLPYRPHVAEVAWILHDTLRAWATTLGMVTADRTTTGDVAQWMYRNLDRIAAHPEAADAWDEIVNAVRQARRAIDRPNDRRLFLGPCGNTTDDGECREEVYGLPWQRTATCPACDFEHDIDRRQSWLQQIAHDHLGTAPEISGFLRMTGVQCTPSQIRGYALRNRLAKAATNQQGHPLYRIRDVLAALNERYQHRKAAS